MGEELLRTFKKIAILFPATTHVRKNRFRVNERDAQLV